MFKASAALATLITTPTLMEQMRSSAQEGPVTRAVDWWESANGDGFTIASDQRSFMTDFSFTAIAPHWSGDAPDGCHVHVELSYDGVNWEEPIIVHESRHGGDEDLLGRRFGELISADGHQFVRYQGYAPSGGEYQLPELVFTYIDASDGPRVEEVFSLAAASRPPIISRSAWGANEALRHVDQDRSKPLVFTPDYETVRHAIVHHSVTPNNRDPMVDIRSIYYYHAVTRGWGDIGYNYLVDRFGNVYEGRFGGENVKGTHSGVFNNGSAGICAMGTFETTDISADGQAGLISIVAWAIRNHDAHQIKNFHGRELPTIFGHRDIGNTSCPGEELYRDLPFIRDAVRRVLTGSSSPGTGSYRSGQSVAIAVNGANVRSGPGTNFSVLRSLNAGVRGTVADGPINSGGFTWYVIRTSGGQGWMATTTFSAAPASSPSPKPPGAFSAGDNVVTASSLSLRSRAGLSSTVLATMAAGTALRITYAYNRADGYEWYKVTGAYGVGWAAGQFLSRSSGSSPSTKPPGQWRTGQTVAVNTDGLSLRTGAGTNRPLIRTLPINTVLTITYAYNLVGGLEWYKVRTPFGDGWVAGQYLRASSASASKPPGRFSVGDLVAVNTASLSLRTGAGLSRSVIASMPMGTPLTITYAYNRVDGYEWYKVRGSYGEGWCAGELLRSRAGTGGPLQIKVGFTVYVNDGPVNLRSSPGTSASVLRSVPQDAKFQVADGPRSANGYTWWQVRSNQWGTGWIAANFIGRR